jgi:hypothetical protein
MKQIFSDLNPLAESGKLKMEGGIVQTGMIGNASKMERFHHPIEDWLHYAGRTFDVENYEQNKKAHRRWRDKITMYFIEHQLSHCEGDPDDFQLI